MDLKIHTKKMPNGIWSCFTTYKIDKAFTGGIEVITQMAEWLKNKPVNPIWEELIIHLPEIGFETYLIGRYRWNGASWGERNITPHITKSTETIWKEYEHDIFYGRRLKLDHL